MRITQLSFDKGKSIFGTATKLFLVGNFFVLSLLSQDVSPTPPSNGHSRPLPDFSYTQGWLGADDAYSVPIGPNKSVWLFGDTFVGTPETKLRSQAKTMVHNSVGISECDQGKTCALSYFWHEPDSPKPRSFFDTGTDDLYYWPLDGFLEGKTLYLSLLAVRNKPDAKLGDAFGFEIVGTKLATVENVQLPPEKWHVGVQDLTDAHLWTGASLVRDGKYVIWYTEVSEGEGRGFMTEMRLPRNKMAKPSGNWEYLNKDNHWVAGLASKDAMHVIEQPISEMSVRYHPSIKKWLALSPGPDFPSPWAVVRSADSPVGPWSSPQKIYEFPEMKRDNPGYDKDTFCYAVKEHIEFADDKIALTYACNSMVLSKTMANMNIYRPRAVILDLPK
jgi:Domain of unknown function (DUF4185)